MREHLRSAREVEQDVVLQLPEQDVHRNFHVPGRRATASLAACTLSLAEIRACCKACYEIFGERFLSKATNASKSRLRPVTRTLLGKCDNEEPLRVPGPKLDVGQVPMMPHAGRTKLVQSLRHKRPTRRWPAQACRGSAAQVRVRTLAVERLTPVGLPTTRRYSVEPRVHWISRHHETLHERYGRTIRRRQPEASRVTSLAVVREHGPLTRAAHQQ